MARYSRLQELQNVGFIVDDAGAIMHRSSGHSQSTIKNIIYIGVFNFTQPFNIRHVPFPKLSLTSACPTYLPYHAPFQNYGPFHVPQWLQ